MYNIILLLLLFIMSIYIDKINILYIVYGLVATAAIAVQLILIKKINTLLIFPAQKKIKPLRVVIFYN